MNHFFLKLQKELTANLQTIDLEESTIIDKAQKSIICIKYALNQLKAFVLNYKFQTHEEEIQFFKVIKPEIVSQLIYFIKINNIESKRPMGSIDNQQKYLLHELEKLTIYFNNHLEFYRYYRMNSTFLDAIFFLRGKDDLHLHIDNLMIYIDPDFSTSQDYMVAKIMANDRLEVFLKTELETLSLLNAYQPGCNQLGYFDQTFQWSDSKTSLIELIYALYAMGSIHKVNNSRYEITRIGCLL